MERLELKRIPVLSLALSPLSPATNPLFEVEANFCGRLLIARGVVYANCGVEKDVVLYNYTPITHGLEKFVLFTPKAAAGYEVLPT